MARSGGPKKVLIGLVVAAALVAVIIVGYRITRPTQITVIVRDAATGEFLGDTLVEVQNNNGQVLVDFVTRADGTAAVKRMDPDEIGYRVVARHIDYLPAARRNVPLRLHETTEVRIALRPKPGGRLYVGLDRALLASIDTASLLIESRRRGPDPLRQWPIRGVAVDPRRPWVYASARYLGYILEPKQMLPVATLDMRGASDGIALTRDGRRLLAFIRNRRTLDVFDAGTGAAVDHVDLTPVPPDARGLIPPGAEVYLMGPALVVEAADGQFAGYFLNDLLVQAGIGATWRWSVLSSDGTTLYVGGPDMEEVLRISSASWEVEARFDVSANLVAAALSPDGAELYAANDRFGHIVVLDAMTGTVLARVPVGKGPTALATSGDGARLYVANGDSLDVSVIDVPSRSVLETVYLGERPFALAVR